MTPLSYDQLIQFLKNEGFSPDFQEESQQVTINVQCDGCDYPTFFRIDEGPMLQLVTFIPVAYTDETVGDTARMLHLINKEVDLPGFGMDENSKTVFFRSVTPCLTKKFDPELLRATIRALEVVSDNFVNAINAVAQGAVTFDEAVAKAMEAQKTKS